MAQSSLVTWPSTNELWRWRGKPFVHWGLSTSALRRVGAHGVSAALSSPKPKSSAGVGDFSLRFCSPTILLLYEANGYRYVENPCVWLKIDEHQTLGIANEALPTALMIKALTSEPWRPGVLDLLGYLF